MDSNGLRIIANPYLLKKEDKLIQNTKLNIIVVENSGYKFDEFKEFENNRFEIITYTKNDISLTDQEILFNNKRNEGKSKCKNKSNVKVKVKVRDKVIKR